MMVEAIELFYSYAHEDDGLRKQLDKHLKLLSRQGIISAWHDHKIMPGGLWEQEISRHLQSARIILLLISPDFMASDYCYGTELQEAMRRHKTGEAYVIPILLRPCDWKDAPFGSLQALPRDGRPITTRQNRDVAFAEIVQELRAFISEINGIPHDEAVSTPTATSVKRKQGKVSKENGEKMNALDLHSGPVLKSTDLNTSILNKAINRYYKELSKYKTKADYESALRPAFYNLLSETADHVNWTLVAEQTIEDNLRPDGVMRDVNNLRRGYWEAKGPNDDLEKEIADKINKGYPLNNTLFENTKKAVLYQGKKRTIECDLQKNDDVVYLLQQFLTYTEPHIEKFQTAVVEFKRRIPQLATDLLGIIEKGHQQNAEFIRAFDNFAVICRSSLDPKLTDKAIDEMLVQHLLTERIFRTVFNNPDFVNRNTIASEIEKVVQALTIHSFNRQEFFKALDRYYIAIEGTAKGIETWKERQEFLNTVYEGFFQGFSVNQADTYGVVYTPQEIVDFMCASTDEVLRREFGKSLTQPGVKVLDPATGTGNFIVNLIRHYIKPYRLHEKYTHDLFCNEAMLLPYYIASLNIEHEYYEQLEEYMPFNGICFVDTLSLEGLQREILGLNEENTKRIQVEKDAQLMVIFGNPPYNAGQKNENQNSKNKAYMEESNGKRRKKGVDLRVEQTYVKDSNAQLNNKSYDVYAKFFRWATDRLQGQDGIVCFISNNSFVHKTALDGMRKHLAWDFTDIYHLDLGGDARESSSGNVFNIRVGVGITMLIRHRNGMEKPYPPATIHYYKVPSDFSKSDKLTFLTTKKSIYDIEWQELQPDTQANWITQGMRPEFRHFLPMGDQSGKSTRAEDSATLFKRYSLGVSTNRDSVVYGFQKRVLEKRVGQFIEDYNAEVSKWIRGGRPRDIDNAVSYEKVKWSEHLKHELQREQYGELHTGHFQQAMYRPFCTRWLYYDSLLVDRPGSFDEIYPQPESERENSMICIAGVGHRRGFGCFATNLITSLDFAFEKVQCFPYYIYSKDGSNRRENITDWALKRFQAFYDDTVTKRDIFLYIYALLHHPHYRNRYAEDLKRDLPRVPLVKQIEAFKTCTRLGEQLMHLHLGYENVEEYELQWQTGKPFSWRVEKKMKLTKDRTALIVNDSLTLTGIPQECFQYKLGSRSALEWIIDQYQVKPDTQDGPGSDPNRLDDKEYIVHLVGKVITVSIETMKLIHELVQIVIMEEPMEESEDIDNSISETIES